MKIKAEIILELMWSSWWEMMVGSDYSGMEDVVRSLSNWTC